jgi:hypothetical protein
MNDDEANTPTDEDVNASGEDPRNINEPRPNKQNIKSIRRTSFLNSYYDLKEDDDDEEEQEQDQEHDGEEEDGPAQSMIVCVDAFEESDRSFLPFEGEDVANSKPIFDNEARETMESLGFDDSRDSSSLEATFSQSNRATVQCSNRTNYVDVPSPPSSPPGDSETPRSPPVLGGYPTRRKGSLERRILLKAGYTRNTVNNDPLLDDNEHLRSSTVTGSSNMHHIDSCLSLASFTSASSVTSGQGVE